MKFLLYVGGDDVRPPDFMRSGYSGKDAFEVWQAALTEIAEVERIDDPAVIAERCAQPNEEDVLVWFGRVEDVPPVLGIRSVMLAGAPPNIAIENLLIEKSLREWGEKLVRSSRIITTSNGATRGIKGHLGEQFPVATVAYPSLGAGDATERLARWSASATVEIDFPQPLIDSASMDLSPDFLVPRVKPIALRTDPVPELAKAGAPSRWMNSTHSSAGERGQARLQGVVYVSDFDTAKENSGWSDLMTAFCDTFREKADATLLLRLSGADLELSASSLIEMLCRYAPMQCRVIAFRGSLQHEAWEQVVAASAWYVHVNGAPDDALALVEFMGRGIPAIALSVPGLEDYANGENSLLVDAYLSESAHFRGTKGMPASRYDVSWQSLRGRFEESYRIAQDRERYREIATRAFESTRARCSQQAVAAQFRAFLRQLRLLESS